MTRLENHIAEAGKSPTDSPKAPESPLTFNDSVARGEIPFARVLNRKQFPARGASDRVN